MTDNHSFLSKNNILLVEDDLLLSNMVTKMLSGDDFEVTAVYTGNDVLNLVKQSYFSLIFLDINLPGKDGFTILKELKNDPVTKDVPVIIFTNHGEIENMERGLALGASDYVIKANMTAVKLKELVSKHLVLGTARYNTHKD
jgi:DNA-binding response OmpR family regulator